jgi:EAL domain-containing protein (putative c-di-GMP-specific phosphodiesterase class I)
MMQDRLLVVDDDSMFRNYVRRIGEASGFETIVTGDAKEFRERIRSRRQMVIVMDLNMPDADGIELMRELANVKSDAKLLIASGADQKVLDTAKRLGAEHGLTVAGTLQKPIRPAQLREMLERLREVDKPLLASALAHAIAHDALLLEYQPKLDCKSRTVTGVEALVRWQHPTRGILPPDQFIALSEQSGLCHDLLDWVVATATMQGASWRRQGLSLDISVNVSTRNFERIDLPDRIARSCESAGFPIEALTLEITESAAMGDPTRAMDVLTRLRLKGFHLSIDDFGTGYSSLVHLQRMPISEIKIDKSFVTQMLRNSESRIIVEMVIALGRKLGHKVTAEGVETADMLASLTEMGADTAQGFGISRPVPADHIGDIVRGRCGLTPANVATISSSSSTRRPNGRAARGPGNRGTDRYTPTRARHSA